MIHFKNLTTYPDYSVQEALGYIPHFLSENDPRSAKEQINQNYSHGGGWSPMPGWLLSPTSRSIRYPGDDPLQAVAEARLRSETILVYPHAWVAIVQEDGSYEVARMD